MDHHCHFFLKKKKRYCKLSVKNGSKYCGEHLLENYNGEDKSDKTNLNERIQCPLDPSHSCYKSRLLKHLQICNAKNLENEEPYISKGYNLSEDDVLSDHLPLSQVSQTIIDGVIKKVNKAFENIVPITEEFLNHDILSKELKNPSYGNELRRQLLQTASLLGHLEKANLIHDHTSYIDFGAGKGKLTYWLAQIIKEQKDSSILLIDCSSLRHKSDNKLKNEQCSLNVKRIRANIADLRLNGIPEYQNEYKKVAIAKHLCGSATDLALRCLTNSIQNESKLNVAGLLIAFCCHHRCNYNSYVGKEYLAKHGFSAKEFTILCSIASWATCGFKKVHQYQSDEQIQRKEEIGRKVKALLNQGRVEFLKKFSFSCRLVNYVSTDISLENTCIVASKMT